MHSKTNKKKNKKTRKIFAAYECKMCKIPNKQEDKQIETIFEQERLKLWKQTKHI